MKDATYQMLLDNLHITYEPDESTVRRVQQEGEAGIAYIKKYGGPRTSFAPGTMGGQLLCEYVLRAEAGALESFQRDYLSDLIQLQAEASISTYAEAVGYEEDI